MSNNHEKIYRNKMGNPVLRVTHIIKILSKEAIIYWSNYLGFKKIGYKQELERTATVGTAVHETVDKIVSYAKLTFDAFEYGIYESKSVKEYLNCMESFTKWYRKNQWLSANRFASDLTLIGDTFGGTLDYVGLSPFNMKKYIIIDFKTSKMFTLSMFLQLAAYIILWEMHYPDKILDGVMILKFDKTDECKAKTRFYSRVDMEIFIELFIHLVDVTLMIKRIEDDPAHDLK